MARKQQNGSRARNFHRSLGGGAAIFVIFMVMSGLTLNHSNGLGLDQRHATQAFLLDWYGLGAPERLESYALGNDWLSFAGSQVYLNGESVATVSNGVGAVNNDDMLIAAGSDELLLLDQDGALVERLPWGPPGAGPIEALGLLEDGAVVVRTATRLWQADTQLLTWEAIGEAPPATLWSSPVPAPENLHQAITRQYRGEGINLERLLLDIHSGRFFGRAGVFFYDLVALAVGFLAISGLVFWLRGKRNGKRNGKRRPTNP
jgi:hypothetical protein